MCITERNDIGEHLEGKSPILALLPFLPFFKCYSKTQAMPSLWFLYYALMRIL